MTDYSGLADQAVAEARRAGLGLDFSPQSLAALDAYLNESLGPGGLSPQAPAWQPDANQARLIWLFGSYFGETLRRALGGRWETSAANNGHPLELRLLLAESLAILPFAQLYRRLKNGTPEALFARYAAARDQLGLKPTRETLDCFKRALESNPRDAKTLGHLGRCLNRMGSFEEAVAYFVRALEVDPKDVENWAGRGESLQGMRCYADALRCFDRALDFDPKNPRAWVLKGISLYRLEQGGEALLCYARALEIDSGYPLAWYHKALSEEGLGRSKEALESYQRFLALNPAGLELEVAHAESRRGALGDARPP